MTSQIRKIYKYIIIELNMVIKSLENIENIGEYKLCQLKEIIDKGEYIDKIETNYILHSHKSNTLIFKIQDGPVKENGINGCQVDEIIKTAKIMIEGLNFNFDCIENKMAINKLDEAIIWLEKRKRNRIKRGVEGYNKQ